MIRDIDLSIVIVNWKVAGLVERLLDSIVAQTSGITLEIFVVDNASADDIVARVQAFRQRNPQMPVTLMLNRKNLGFAAACNQAIRKSLGRYVVLLNPDTEVLDGALQKMVARMDALPDVGVAGPMVVDPDGFVQRSVRRLPSIADQGLVLLKVPHLKFRPAALKRYFHDDFAYNAEADVEQVMGAAFFIRRECLDHVGLLDERFFIWFEEVDFCKRALEAKWRVLYTPVARIKHVGGASFAQELLLMKQKMLWDSMRKYFQKHHGAGAAALLVPGYLGGLALISMHRVWKRISTS